MPATKKVNKSIILALRYRASRLRLLIRDILLTIAKMYENGSKTKLEKTKPPKSNKEIGI
jgi:hypothetical protein